MFLLKLTIVLKGQKLKKKNAIAGQKRNIKTARTNIIMAGVKTANIIRRLNYE